MDAFDLRQWEGFAAAGGSPAEPVIIDQIIIDSRRIDSPRALFVALIGEKDDGHRYVQQAASAGAKYALVSQQWAAPLPTPEIKLLRVPNPLQAFQEIARTYRLQLQTKIIGIAGSFGKTMVKDLLHALLGTEKRAAASPESFNSQIGVALSLLTLGKEHEIAVIEAAISEPQEMDILADMIRPDHTILTPIGKKHIATLNNIDTLVDETTKLIQATSSNGWALIPQEYQEKEHLPSRVYLWDRDDGVLPHASPFPENSLVKYQVSFPGEAPFSVKSPPDMPIFSIFSIWQSRPPGLQEFHTILFFRFCAITGLNRLGQKSGNPP